MQHLGVLRWWRHLEPRIHTHGLWIVRIDVPSTSTSWPRVSCTSPVPGGMSSTRTSSLSSCSALAVRLRQSTSNKSWWTAFCTMRPLHTTGLSFAGDLGRRYPMDIVGMPLFVMGIRAPAASLWALAKGKKLKKIYRLWGPVLQCSPSPWVLE